MDDQQMASGTISRSQRIMELNSIDKDITGLVQAAGLAIKALTLSPLPSTEAEDPQITLDSQRTAFSSAAADYFRLLDSVGVRLRRQIYALEEADIIAGDVPLKDNGSVTSRAATSTGTASQTRPASEKIGNTVAGGLGSLDLAWLNSRSDAVGREMEAEIWTLSRSLLQTIEKYNIARALKDPDDGIESKVEPMDTDNING